MDAKKTLYENVRDGILGFVSGVSKQVKERKGVPGSIANGVEELVRDANQAVGTLHQSGKQVHENVQEAGGYAHVLKQSLGIVVANAAEKSYASMGNFFTEDGEFDYDKASQAVQQKASVVRDYGLKAYETLVEIASRGSEAVEREYHELFPTQAELEGRFKGIGAGYKFILLKAHYEDCLAFHEQMDSQIPEGTPHKREALEDIKISASADFSDLEEFYEGTFYRVMHDAILGGSILRRLDLIEKYSGNEAEQ